MLPWTRRCWCHGEAVDAPLDELAELTNDECTAFCFRLYGKGQGTPVRYCGTGINYEVAGIDCAACLFSSGSSDGTAVSTSDGTECSGS